MQPQENYLVLARKYRPRTFADLYGQDALVQTLSNAINSGRIHHAYVLTGIRGTGKTTSARIIAKALNCENGPSTTWAEDDPQAKAIQEGRHVDVLEFDAASHRGVDDVQQLFEGVAYAPVEGRYKVYIIDEVHMLSKQAFNALLKTLEEPPANVIFIFATTEVKKVPVTILSRCMRFDLKRITVSTLRDLYNHILSQENLHIDAPALDAIARAADGSARDGLSLLDQAIALSGGETIATDVVNNMLGLGDRSRVLDVLDSLLAGDAPQVLSLMDNFYALGQDPVILLNELLSATDSTTRLKIVPGLQDKPQISELDRTRLCPLAEQMPLENLTRLYQLLLQAITDVKQADRPHEAACMALVRITHLATLPPVATLLNQAESSLHMPAPSTGGVDEAAQKKTPEPSVNQPEKSSKNSQKNPPNPTTWADVVAVVKQARPALAATLVAKARPVRIEPGQLEATLEAGFDHPDETRQALQKVLVEATQSPWEVKLHAPDAIPEAGQTLAEEATAAREQKRQDIQQEPVVKQALDLFPGAEVIVDDDEQRSIS